MEAKRFLNETTEPDRSQVKKQLSPKIARNQIFLNTEDNVFKQNIGNKASEQPNYLEEEDENDFLDLTISNFFLLTKRLPERAIRLYQRRKVFIRN